MQGMQAGSTECHVFVARQAVGSNLHPIRAPATRKPVHAPMVRMLGRTLIICMAVVIRWLGRIYTFRVCLL
jgi:hypothetical protein